MHLLYLASSLCCLSLKLSWLLLWQKSAIQATRGLNSPPSQSTLCIIRYGNNKIVTCTHTMKHISLNLCNILYEWVSSIFPVTAATITLNWQRQLRRISIWPVSDEVLKENVNLQPCFFHCLFPKHFADQIHQDLTSLFCTLAFAIYLQDILLLHRRI